jgi:hypothetical protein
MLHLLSLYVDLAVIKAKLIFTNIMIALYS